MTPDQSKPLAGGLLTSSVGRARSLAGRVALKSAARLNRRHYAELAYPPSSEPGPRYGFGRPLHERLESTIASHRDRYEAELTSFLPFAAELAAIPVTQNATLAPCWRNPFFFGIDGVALYSMLRSRSVGRYVEVGSGHSTRFAARAREDAGATFTITSIDPYPRAEIDALCDRVIRSPLETIDVSELTDLRRGDVLVMDGSHYVFTNSDTVAFFLDVLPAVPDGVRVGIHDICLPYDYVPEWTGWSFAEQYLLACYLLAPAPWIDPVLPCYYVSQDPRLAGVLDPVWRNVSVAPWERVGFMFWFDVRRS